MIEMLQLFDDDKIAVLGRRRWFGQAIAKLECLGICYNMVYSGLYECNE